MTDERPTHVSPELMAQLAQARRELAILEEQAQAANSAVQFCEQFIQRHYKLSIGDNVESDGRITYAEAQ